MRTWRCCLGGARIWHPKVSLGNNGICSERIFVSGAMGDHFLLSLNWKLVIVLNRRPNMGNHSLPQDDGHVWFWAKSSHLSCPWSAPYIYANQLCHWYRQAIG